MKPLAIAFILISISLSAQNAREIVDHYLDTVSGGNIGNWKKITSEYSEYVSYYNHNNYDQKVDLLRLDKPSFGRSYLRGIENKVELYEDSLFTHLNSSFYFLKDSTILVMANIPPVFKKPEVHDEFYSNYLPVQIWKLAKKSKSIELTGIKEFPVDGFSCYEIRMTTQGRHYVLFINTRTFLLEYWNGREDGDLSYLVKYFNYSKVGDVLIPMSEYAMRNGSIFFWQNRRKVVFNPAIDPEEFHFKRYR